MKYLTIKELKVKLARSPNSVYDLVKSGQIPKPVLLGGQNVWREQDIDAAIQRLADEQGAGWEAETATD